MHYLISHYGARIRNNRTTNDEENSLPMDWWMALAGGALIGLAAAVLMLFQGRIAGISGIFGGLLTPRPSEIAWRTVFIAGLVVTGGVLVWVLPSAFVDSSGRGLGFAVAAGLAVGVGTRMGSGCTSGHGVCGLSRLSPRSLVATLTFIGTGVLTVFAIGALG